MKHSSISTTFLAIIFILLASVPFTVQAGGKSLRPAEQATLRVDRWAQSLENEASQLKQQTPRVDAARGLFSYYSKTAQPAGMVISDCKSSGYARLVSEANNLENALNDLENAIQLFDFTNSSGVIMPSTYSQQLNDIIAKAALVRQISGCIRTEIQVIRGGN